MKAKYLSLLLAAILMGQTPILAKEKKEKEKTEQTKKDKKSKSSSEFSNKKLYTLTCRRGDLILSQDGKALTSDKLRPDAPKGDKNFAIISFKEKLYIVNPKTNEFLQAYNFEQLDESKNWYDVTISHMAQKMGFENILQISNPVLHRPHSSRPWKQLKYTNPLLYYWRKLTQGRDKI